MKRKIYKRKSIRLKAYDYSTPGYYSITICTKKGEYIFGEVILKKMVPSIGGEMVIQFWHQIPDHYPGVKIHEFQLMPNHIHGIIEITEGIRENLPVNISERNPQTDFNMEANKDSIMDVHGDSIMDVHKGSNMDIHRVSGRAQNLEPLQSTQEHLNNDAQLINTFQHIIPKSLGSIVRGYKIGVTKWFRENTVYHDVWHRNFFDRILKSANDLIRTTKYIQNNPKYWVHDRFYRK